MQRNNKPFQVVHNLIATFKEIHAHDVVYIDDDTLLRINQSHDEDVALGTEKNLSTEIARLRSSGVKVYALTARIEKYSEATKKQLASLNIELNGILHAPNDHSGASNQSTKGHALTSHLTTLTETPKRVVFIDDDELQIEAVKSVLSNTKYRYAIYQYKRQCKRLNIEEIFE